MPITTLQTEAAGFGSFQPRHGRMVTTDILSKIITAGYINNSPTSKGLSFSNGDFLDVLYSDGAGGTTSAIFQLSIPYGSSTITLQLPSVDTPAYVQNIIPGTSAASKAIVLDSSSEIDGVNWTSIKGAGTYYYGQEMAGLTTVSTTPGSGQCAVQFQLLNSVGSALAQVTPFSFYISDDLGNLSSAVTSFAALTNGTLTSLVTGQVCFGTTDSSGRIGVTLTAIDGTYFITFVAPNGEKFTSSGLVCS